MFKEKKFRRQTWENNKLSLKIKMRVCLSSNINVLFGRNFLHSFQTSIIEIVYCFWFFAKNQLCLSTHHGDRDRWNLFVSTTRVCLLWCQICCWHKGSANISNMNVIYYGNIFHWIYKWKNKLEWKRNDNINIYLSIRITIIINNENM